MSRDLALTNEALSNLFSSMVAEAMRIEASRPSGLPPKTTNICICALQAVKESFNAELGIDIDTLQPPDKI